MEIKDFNAIRISLASPEEIRSWSYGEVTKPETINYRRLRPERDGLFCEAIFGPTKDWQCYCGKYKKVRFKGIVCDKCGVEVTRSAVRRERMGHIELASPVAHIWYTRRVPSYLGLLLDISRRNLDRVLYFAQYVITRVDENARQKALKRIDEELEREITRLRHSAAEQQAELDRDTRERASELRAELDRELKRLDQQRDERVNELMTAGGVLRELLNARKGQTAQSDIIFAPLDLTIVQEGEKIVADEAIAELNTAIEAELTKIEAVTEQQKRDKQVRLTHEIDQVERGQGTEKQDFQNELADKIARIQVSREDERDELKNLRVLQFLNEAQYRELYEKYGHIFEARMGAEALYEIVKGLDLEKLAKELRVEIRRTKSKQRRKKATKRLKVVEALRRSANRPEWMILTVLPVIPPDLRPMVQLDGGRFATSDLNDLYRRVINRNNRLKRLLDLDAPDVIIRNEKRMLQEAVDSLIDNSRRGKAVSLRGKRKLKSLSDMLKGKQGRFRRNLLGKRVDYSGRSVIVVGPHLKLHECGLPKKMALELFKPFVINKLVEENYAPNVKGAKRIIEQMRPEVWGILEKVIKGRPVLLNRAPTLHRLGIQAFTPTLIEGDAIQIHPLVTTAFNADFDGDQMAVHVPLSEMAVKEAEGLMLSSKNLLKPADGEPTVSPTKDMVLGCYYLTMMGSSDLKGADRIFASPDEAVMAYELNQVHLHAPIKVRLARWFEEMDLEALGLDDTTLDALLDLDIETVGQLVDRWMADGRSQTVREIGAGELRLPGAATSVGQLPPGDGDGRVKSNGAAGALPPLIVRAVEQAFQARNLRPERFPKNQIVETTVGRILFNEVVPAPLGFRNDTFGKSRLKDLVADCYNELGVDATAQFVDDLKNIGFKYATRSGVTIAVEDIEVPAEKQQILEAIGAQVEEIERQFRRGLITEEELYRKTVELWTKAKDDVTEAVAKNMSPTGSIAIMANSGATKGGFQPVAQLAGMRGLMADPSGRIISLPIRSNFREGLNALEYFISTHGARKGLADTALRTADAGYLTRRLVDVAQDVIIREPDCGTEEGIRVTAEEARQMNETLGERVLGRFAARPVANPATGEIIVDRNEIIDEEVTNQLNAAGVSELWVRSPLTCRMRSGLCQMCYGRDLGRGDVIRIGEAVGIIAAQSIGEPGTQLTLRTFHTGGVAGVGDITQGLPRVTELFEARNPKGEAIIAEIGGRVEIDREGEMRLVRIVDAKVMREEIPVPTDYEITVEDGDRVRQGEVLARGEGDVTLEARHEGTVLLEGHLIILQYDHKEVKEYEIPPTARLRVAEGDILEPGFQITEGAKNPHQILRIQGRDAVQLYLVEQVQQVYRSQGVAIHDKHIEIIVRNMLRRVRVKHPGDTNYLLGDLIDRLEIEEVNERLIARDGQPAVAEPVLLGITKASLITESFLSASSFQHTINVLAQAAIEGKVDRLEGLKENVIIGKLIPAGTGYRSRQDGREEELETKLVVGEVADEEFDFDLDELEEFDEFEDEEFEDEEFDEFEEEEEELEEEEEEEEEEEFEEEEEEEEEEFEEEEAEEEEAEEEEEGLFVAEDEEELLPVAELDDDALAELEGELDEEEEEEGETGLDDLFEDEEEDALGEEAEEEI